MSTITTNEAHRSANFYFTIPYKHKQEFHALYSENSVITYTSNTITLTSAYRHKRRFIVYKTSHLPGNFCLRLIQCFKCSTVNVNIQFTATLCRHT